jgi:hypothetical protein
MERAMRGLAWGVAVTAAAVVASAAGAQDRQTDADWLAQCRERHWGNENRAVFCDVRVVRLTRPAAGTPLSIDGGRNGGASIRGVDGDSLVAHARIQAFGASQASADAAGRAIVVHSDGNRLGATGPERGDDVNWSVVFDVFAPRAIDLDVVAQNGPVAIHGVHGAIRLTAQNGPIAIDGAGGDVRARATNGPLAVHLTGVRWDGAGLDAETRNGPVALTVPDGYSAALETGTDNGPFVSDVALTVQGRINRHLQTTLGSGGPPVRAMTTNGPVVIRRARERESGTR